MEFGKTYRVETTPYVACFSSADINNKEEILTVTESLSTEQRKIDCGIVFQGGLLNFVNNLPNPNSRNVDGGILSLIRINYKT